MSMRVAVAIVLALAARAEAQAVLDFVTFDGVHYVRWAEEPGRALTRDDLGIEFATAECSFAEHLRRSSTACGQWHGGLPSVLAIIILCGRDADINCCATDQAGRHLP